MQRGTSQDRPKRGVATAEARLFGRLARIARVGEAKDDDETERPGLAFLPPIRLIEAPRAAAASALGDDQVRVHDTGPSIPTNLLLGCLRAFVDLYDANQQKVVAFAKNYGSLRLCPCGASLGHEHSRAVLEPSPAWGQPRVSRRAIADALTKWRDAEIYDWIGKGSTLTEQARRGGLFGALSGHMADEGIVGGDFVGRLAHLLIGPGVERAERVEHWRAEARRVRALIVLSAFVAVTIQEDGASEIEAKLIPFLPVGFVSLNELAAEAFPRPVHLTTGIVRYVLAGEANRRIVEACVTVGLDHAVASEFRATNWTTLSDGQKKLVERGVAAGAEVTWGARAPTLSALLALQLAGVINSTVTKGTCKQPGCGRALVGRQTLVCDNAQCRTWADTQRKRRRRPKPLQRVAGPETGGVWTRQGGVDQW